MVLSEGTMEKIPSDIDPGTVRIVASTLTTTLPQALSLVYELFKGREDTDFAYKNMICTVFRNFNIVSFNDNLSAGGFFSSVEHRWKEKTT
jgi:hypothetical protein